MKKIYSLLLLLTVFFGFGGIKGYANPFDPEKEYHIKLGGSFLKGKTIVSSEGEASIFKLNVSQTDKTTPDVFSILAQNAGGKFRYKNGKFSSAAKTDAFVYVTENGKQYIKTTEADHIAYLTKEGSKVTLKPTASDDAIAEIIDRNAAPSGDVGAKFKPYGWLFAMFQHQHIVVTGSETYSPSLLYGAGLGQYVNTLNMETEKVGSMSLKHYVQYLYASDGGKYYTAPAQAPTMRSTIEKILGKIVINKPSKGMYVRISNKSQYEHDMRETTKDRLFPLNGGNAFSTEGQPGSEVAAKYLKETAAGFTTTTNANEAAVFFYDGEHLTSVSNGLGLTTTNYATTGAAQKVTVGQGKIEKTFDAGSYSLKTAGGQFVKLEASGVSLSANESDSHLFLEEVEKFNLSTLAQGYVSFYAPTAVEFPEGTEVYVGKLNGANSAVNFTKLNTRQVPANTAVVLRKGTAAGTALEVKKLATASAVSNNALKGYTVSSTDHKAGAYALSTEGGQLVFKKVGDAVRGFKAVIYKNGGAGAPAYLPVDILPTGIDAVNADNTEEEVFDLTGRRVESPVKGKVYVKNGKKFVQQ